MNEFERELPSYRLAETHHGDDLQAVAHRELGDANRWPELVWINNLVHPYITDDERLAGPGVLLSGSLIMVPSPRGIRTDDAERGQVFQRDAVMVNRRLVVDESGDLSVVAGVDNLRQQLSHRIITPRGQARRHPEYGCMVWRIMGKVNGSLSGMLGAEYVKATLAADYRVAEVVSATAEVVGDDVRIHATARAIDGGIVDLFPTKGVPSSPGDGYGNNYGQNWGI